MPTRVAEERHVSPHQLEAFTRQLGALMGAGVDILRALEVASKQSGNAHLDEVSGRLRTALEDGRDFHWAIARYPHIFSPFYIQMARQGEEEGVLGPALLTIADHLSRDAGMLPGDPAVDGSGAHTSAPTSPAGHYISTVMLAVAAGLLGTGALWGAAILNLWPIDWVGPFVTGWAAICLAAGASSLRRGRKRPAQPGSAPVSTTSQKPTALTCSVCGLDEKTVGRLSTGNGVAICDECMRRSISELKTPERRQAEADAIARGEALAGGTPLQPPPGHDSPRNGGARQAFDDPEPD